jgi:hypothetical protein
MKQLIEDLITAMEYHIEQTRPVHMTTVAIQAAKDALKAMATTPPAAQRQWVGLTDEERKEIAEQCIQPLIFLVKDHAQAIEAKLREKNT